MAQDMAQYPVAGWELVQATNELKYEPKQEYRLLGLDF